MVQLIELPRIDVNLESPDFTYWGHIAPEDPMALAAEAKVKQLAQLVLLQEQTAAPFANTTIDKLPALQAEAWYHLLGPLNNLEESSSYLARAANIMQNTEIAGPAKAEIDLDSAYLLTDLARVSSDKEERRSALNQALRLVQNIESSDNFNEQSAIYILQTYILGNDILQEAARLYYAGEMQPVPLQNIEQYRKFEKAFADVELTSIDQFKKLVNEGITDRNFGILVEWYYLIARRHQAWSDEEIDTVSIRGATSRENHAGWTSGSGIDYPAPRSGNHDAVITTYRPNREPQIDRIQLKAYDHEIPGDDKYDKTAISIIYLPQIIKDSSKNIDRTTERMMQNLSLFAADYTQNTLS